MTVIITKYFIEKTDNDYENHNRIWEENRHRMVFLQMNLPKSRQIITEINNNFYLKNIRYGIGIPYNNTVWLHNEIWIYSMSVDT